jgi:selenocysteine lyase/cysteine desulfurase
MTSISPSLWSTEKIRQQIVGIDQQVPLLDGRQRTYINLDNAASTPSLKPVQEKVNAFLEWYSSVHRGAGFKSQLSTWAYEEAREIVLRFVGADPQYSTAVFGKNTTEMLNKLAHRYRARGKRVLTTIMEHHSNLLPWRADGGMVDYVAMRSDGQLDEDDLLEKLEAYDGEVALVAVSGASNVTGHVTDIHRLAEIAHRFGARILVDAAQLAPHRRVAMGHPADPAHVDFLVLSAHKMYAPFGTGALIGPTEIFAEGEPDQVGGGVVDVVTLERTVWNAPPERDEAGSPNVVGAIALAVAAETLQSIGWERIEGHERELTTYALQKMRDIPGLRVLGSADPAAVDHRLGALTFVMGDLSHSLVAAILAHEYGIGVRNGCFCAHPYLMKLLGISPEDQERYQAAIERGDRTQIPGAVRASLGIYSTQAEVDELIRALGKIASGEITGTYLLDQTTGDYTPEGYTVDFEGFFSFV